MEANKLYYMAGMIGRSSDELRESEYYAGRRVPFD